MNEEFLEQLKSERDDLSERVGKLSVLINSDEFWGIYANQRCLLRIQLGVMKSYLDILNLRLEEMT